MPFQDLGCTGAVMVRTALADNARWVYAANFTACEAGVLLGVRGGPVRDAVTGAAAPLRAGRLSVALAPYELRVRRASPRAAIKLAQPARPPEPEVFPGMKPITSP